MTDSQLKKLLYAILRYGESSHWDDDDLSDADRIAYKSLDAVEAALKARREE